MSNELEIAFQAGFNKESQDAFEGNPFGDAGGYDEERAKKIREGFEEGNVDEEGWLDWMGF